MTCSCHEIYRERNERARDQKSENYMNCLTNDLPVSVAAGEGGEAARLGYDERVGGVGRMGEGPRCVYQVDGGHRQISQGSAGSCPQLSDLYP